MPAIDIKGLSFSYPGNPRKVLSGLSLKVEKGDFLGLIGKTGCGKSTLLLTLNGLIPQMIRGELSGSVEVLGKGTASVPVHELARSVAFVFQDPDDQIFSLRVEDEVMFGLTNLGVRGDEAIRRTDSALKMTGLEDSRDSDPHTLSHGQKQKLAFACALAIQPEIFVLDEPVSSLDHASSEEIYSILRKLNSQGRTIIIAEHDTEWLAEYSTRISVLDRGRIISDGGREVLFEKAVKNLGLKVPCSVQISEALDRSVLTPSELAVILKKRNGPKLGKKTRS